MSLSKLILIILGLLSFGCASKISPFASANKYDSDVYIHIDNMALKLYYKSPADIDYIIRRRPINKSVTTYFNEVNAELLIYGSTEFPPYEISLWLSETRITPNEKQVTADTLVDGTYFTFMGFPKEKRSARALKGDMDSMLKSMVIGKGYNQVKR